MINLIVYADILLTVNLVVNYILLSVVDCIIKINPKIYRLIVSAFIGALSSFYIFFRDSTIFIDLAVKIAICVLMSITAFGFKGFKKSFKNFIILFSVTCVYGGLMIALWHIFKPKGMIIYNSVVYFNISPIILILLSVFFYFIFKLLFNVFSTSSIIAKKCSVRICLDKKTIELKGIVDTGNSISDPFGNSHIVIIDESNFERLIADNNYQNRYRLIPCKTVSGYDCLDAVRCDKCFLVAEDKEIILNNPIVAKSKTKFTDEYNAIINPKSFE